jgi:hypothetical protein
MGVFAQTTPPPIGTIPEKVAPDADTPYTDLSNKKGIMSDKLNQTNGVIHPEGAVDSKMEKPAPANGSMPVIKPPVGPNDQPK